MSSASGDPEGAACIGDAVSLTKVSLPISVLMTSASGVGVAEAAERGVAGTCTLSVVGWDTVSGKSNGIDVALVLSAAFGVFTVPCGDGSGLPY
jgi:hypothetical protein